MRIECRRLCFCELHVVTRGQPSKCTNRVYASQHHQCRLLLELQPLCIHLIWCLFLVACFKNVASARYSLKFVPRTSSSLASAVQPGKPTQQHCVFDAIACKMVPQHIRMQLKCDQCIPGGVYLRPSAQVKVRYIKCSGAQVFDIRAHQPILLHWILKGIFQVFDIALIQYIQV